MYEGQQFRITNPNWRKSTLSKDVIILAEGVETTEEEVLLAIELLTPITLKNKNRYPMIGDIITFIAVIRGE